jgi:phospholipase C
MEPIAAFAPSASIADLLAGSLLITVTAWPCLTRISVKGLLMFPREPVIVKFIYKKIDTSKISIAGKEDLSGSAFDLAEFVRGEVYLDMKRNYYKILIFAGVLTTGCHVQRRAAGAGESPQGIQKVGHIVVIYMENHSFDNLYGEFPGAEGLSTATPGEITQVDSNGHAYAWLPPIAGNPAFPTNLPNGVFNIDQYVSADKEIPDVLHRYYQEQKEIDGGRMDRFVQYNFSKGLAMGYYKTSMLPLAAIARKYTLCDHFFHSAFGGSFLNHQWLIAAMTPVNPGAPDRLRMQFDPTGALVHDGTVTPDGYVVNTSYSVNAPRPKYAHSDELVPNQTAPTIGDRLSAKGISWAWYAEGWDSAVAGAPDSLTRFEYHHQPFMYFAKYAGGTRARKEHLRDETEFLAAAKAGRLPAVSFVKPSGLDDEHPNESDVFHSESDAVDLINAVMGGPNGKDAVVILTYDENGGFWDHVPPPVIDKWGPGTRIPAIIISPFAKKGFVDHTTYETVSILAFIEKRWGLKPLQTRDAAARPLDNAFDFSQTP